MAFDDGNYIEYFSRVVTIYEKVTLEDADWWLTLIDEPLWDAYATALGTTFGPEAAFRITIFAGVFLYLFSATRLSKGGLFTVLFFFALHPSIGLQLYFNQIRQGLAFSIFLLFVSTLKLRMPIKLALASGLASLVHTSFVLILSLVASYFLRPRIRIFVFIAFVVIFAFLVNYIDLFSMINVGRREGVYTSGASVNINFYIVTLTTYGMIFYFLWPDAKETDAAEWYFLSFSIAAAMIGMVSAFDGGGRYVCISDAAISILIARNIQAKYGLAAFGVMVCAMGIQIISNLKQDSSVQMDIFEKWRLIILGSH